MQVLNKQRFIRFVQEHGDLFDRAEPENPFAGSAWTLDFLRHVAGDDWSFAIAGEEGDGLMLLYGDPQAAHRRYALANHYVSFHSPVLAAGGDRGAAVGRLVREMVAGLAGCAAIQLWPLDPDSPDTHALCRSLAGQGWYVKRYFKFGNWYLPCAGLSFQDYMAGRDSRLLNTWRRKARKFRAGAGSGQRLQIVTGPEGLETALAAYEKVYARSWKTSESHPEFIRAWARTCAQKGWLRLGLAWVGDVPVAAQFWFTLHGRANIFKLAYDEDYAGLSAGTVLTAHLFEYSLDRDRVAEIDYLSGDDPYKQSWMADRRERIGLLACNLHTVRGLALAATEAAGDAWERWRRVLRPGSGRGIAVQP